MSGKKQVEKWDGEFGEEYTKRNRSDVDGVDQLYNERYGISRTEMLKRTLDDLDRDIRILEVGTNIGSQLKCFQEIGFERLYGIDVQRKAIKEAHKNRPELDVIYGDASDIPFKNDFFDLVFTDGVLIHIPPDIIDDVMDEIDRVSSKWIYGLEYYSEEYQEVNYRGNSELLWKADFPSLYKEGRNVNEVTVNYLDYQGNENVDVEFLLSK